MGVEYTLACSTCQVFLDLHKWPILEEAAQVLMHAHYPQHEPGPLVRDSILTVENRSSPSRKVFVSACSLRDSLAAGYPQHDYILQLAPVVDAFCSNHDAHDVFISCDLGDPGDAPWHPDQPEVADWLQLSGPFNYDHFLPRNLIEVFDLREWPETLPPPLDKLFADAYLTDEQFEAVKSEFRRRVRELLSEGAK